MSRTDRQGKPLFALRTMGRTVEVRGRGGIPEQFLDGLRASWADCELVDLPADGPDGASAGLWGLLVGAGDFDEEIFSGATRPDFTVEVGASGTWPLAAQQFTTNLTMALIRTHAGRRHLFHAASLMDPRTGDTLVLIGPSGRGKTTASIALARDGWAYLTDETTVVEHDSPAMTSFAKPLSVIEVPGEPKVQSAAGSLGMRLLGETDPQPRLRRLVVLDRLSAEEADEDVDRLGAVIEPMDQLEALQILMEQSSGLAKTRDGLRGLAELADTVGGIHRVVYREAERLSECLREWLRTGGTPARRRSEARSRPDWTFHPAPGGGSSAASRGMAEGRDPESLLWTRDSSVQGIEIDDRVLLLRKDRSFVLNPLSSRVWLLLRETLDPGGLLARLEPEFGPAPDGAVAEILQKLMHDELVAPAEVPEA